jgi:hypothetical protein
MIPELKPLVRYLAVMTIVMVALGTFLRLATRCEQRTLLSLNLAKIVSCAKLRAEEERR